MAEVIKKPKEIFKLIPLIMKEVGGIEKTRKPEAGIKYAFRGIDDFLAALQPAFINHGVFTVPTVVESHREERVSKGGGVLTFTRLHVEYRFFAPDGSSVTALTVGEAMDSSDKSCNKAMSAAMKYALTQVFCVPTQEPKDTEDEHLEIDGKNMPGKNGQIWGGDKGWIDPPQTVDMSPRFISDAQRKRLFAIKGKAGWTDAELKALVKRVTGQDSTKSIAWTMYDAIWKEIELNPKKQVETGLEPLEPGDDRYGPTEV